MTKLCPRGKAAAKRKFRVYPSAYANAYASKICAGKIKDPSGVKRKDFKGRKPAAAGGQIKESNKNDKKTNSVELIKKRKDSKKEALEKIRKELGMRAGGRAMKAGGGLMEATARLRRQGLKEGGNSKSRTNPDNLTGKQILELDKLGLLSKSKLKMNPKFDVVKSAKVSGPIESVLRGGKVKKNRSKPKFKAMGGRINYRKGGGVCLRGMNRDAIGKNS